MGVEREFETMNMNYSLEVLLQNEAIYVYIYLHIHTPFGMR